MTLAEWFTDDKVTREDLTDLAEESDYWESCEKFVRQNWNRDVKTLSEKQVNWASRILEDLVEKRIEGQRRA